jgi:hypothetical protein
VPADERFLRPEIIKPVDVTEEPNAAVRSALLERMGLARFLTESEGTVVATDTDVGGIRELIRVPVQVTTPEAEPILGLKVFCPSTGHMHFLRVPPATRSCAEAAAWLACKRRSNSAAV